MWGGYDGQDKNDVWRSGDGENWDLATESAAFSERNGHQAVSYGGSLWVIGGNDVWRSADGVSWGLVTASAAFSGLSEHQVVVFRSSEYFHEATEILMDSPGVQAVPVNGTVPMTLLTLEATGGVGGLRFDLVGDDAKVARVGADGVLVVTSLLTDGVTATVTARVRDSALINNWSEVAVTLAFSFPLSFVSSATEFVVSPDYSGVVLTMTAMGGSGGYAYSRVRGNSAVTVDAETGVVSLVTALPAGSLETVVFVVRDEIGGSARFTMSLRVDDSGALVTEYGDVMFLVGGVFRNDVWRSVDGVSWISVPVSGDVFSRRRAHHAVAYGGSLWLVGGYDGRYRSDVWRSADGVSWDLVPVSGDRFSGRWFHQLVSHGGSLWVVGGDDGRHRNDVWRSADGENWDLVTVSAAFSGRRHHQAVSYGGSLWVVGGSDGSKYLNDVWRSADGEDWVLAPVSGDRFSVRYGHHAVSYGGSLWVVGGSDDDKYFNDVWRSTDGESWDLVTVSAAFSGRWGHYAVSYGGSLWIVGGRDGRGYVNDVWRSADGVRWEVATLTAAFSARWGHQVVVAQGPLPFVYEVAEIGAVAPDERLVVNSDDALPLTVATLAATGGGGALRFEVVGDDRGVAAVGRDGALVATAFLGSREWATVSVRVDDGTPVNDALTVAVTLFFVVPLAFPRVSVGYVVSPDFVGVVHSLMAMGGVGDYRYERVAGDPVLTVDAEGVVSLTAALQAGGRAMAVFVARDEIGGVGAVEFGGRFSKGVWGGDVCCWG